MSYGGKGGGVEGGGADGEWETESKYEKLYEADLDPFKEFDSRKLCCLDASLVQLLATADVAVRDRGVGTCEELVCGRQPSHPKYSRLGARDVAGCSVHSVEPSNHQPTRLTPSTPNPPPLRIAPDARDGPAGGAAEEKEARRGQMGFLERWLFVASGTVLRNRFRRHLLLVYLLVLHGLLLLLPGGASGGARDTGADGAAAGVLMP